MALGVFAAVFLLLFALTSTTEVAAIESTELDSMLNAIRDRGYHLFSNAIAASDIVLEILAGKSFTFFAPTDSALFALDMSETASDYITTLRCHIIPFRISVADLRSFPPETYFPTLFKSHRATILSIRLPLMAASHNFITVDGVSVTFPGLFYSLNIAVHGLRGIINCNSLQGQGPPSESQPVLLNITGRAESPSSGNFLNGEAPSPSPENLHDDHSFGSPVVSQNQLLSPSPTSREIPNNGIVSPEREQPTFGPVPANFRELLPPQISPASDLWFDAPTPAATFVSRTEPPVASDLWFDVPTPAATFISTTEPPVATEFSENDDPMSFPPSSMMMKESAETSLQNKGFSSINIEEGEDELRDSLPVTWSEDLHGIMESVTDKSQPSNERNFDWTRTSTANTFCSSVSNNF